MRPVQSIANHPHIFSALVHIIPLLLPVAVGRHELVYCRSPIPASAAAALPGSPAVFLHSAAGRFDHYLLAGTDDGIALMAGF